MRRFAFLALIFFFVLLYTAGVWGRVGVPRLAVQAALMALPLIVLLSGGGPIGKPAPGFLFVWFYLGWSISACIHNGEGVVRGLLYTRFLVTAYIVFWAMWRSRFTRRQLMWIHATVLAMFFLQVAAAIFELLVLKESVEAHVGTMEYESGAIATSFPMFAFSCMLALFLYYGRPILLFAGFSFILVGHASGKLATYYFIPAMLVLGLVLYTAREGLSRGIRRSAVVALIGVCAMPFALFLLSHTYRAEMLQQETGVYNKLKSFMDITRAHALESRSWYTSTRTGTSLRVIEETFRRSPSVFLFGQGTHTVFQLGDKEAYDEYGITYGIVGWSADAVAVGWPAMFAHAGFFIYLFYLVHRRRHALNLDTYWQAMLLAVELGFFVFLLVYFAYSTSFTVKGWLSCVHLFFLAPLLARQYQKALCPGHLNPVRKSVRFPLPVIAGAARGRWTPLSQMPCGGR